MRYLLLTLLLVTTAFAETAMKTHSSVAKNSKLTVVHYGAPW